MNVIIIGGGAAGFFAALRVKEHSPQTEVILLERSSQLLAKVRISGGGRCNTTHSCFDPKELVKNYPRGQKELLGPFTRFQPADTISWFASHGVELKTEEDGRMFPVTDNSSTIIDCLMAAAKKSGVQIRLKASIETIQKADHGFAVTLNGGETIRCISMLLATGSNPSGHKFAQQFGHTITPLVPSLFTFNIPTSPLKELSGIVVDPCQLRLDGTTFTQCGPLLITHWGFSGPAALKLSAWAARYLNEKNYKTGLSIDWAPKFTSDSLLNKLKEIRQDFPAQTLANNSPLKLPKKLWKQFIELSLKSTDSRLSEISNDELAIICSKLKNDNYQIDGKTTHKEEFVTCGGVALSEVNFKTMQSRLCEGLFFAGEILDVDAVTGGFNFQNAWTTGWIAGSSMA